jgi:uncharacterized membrane protein YoaK (UPF0700 family)
MQQLDHHQRRLAIVLAGLAGFVDAVGFLSAGGYFVSFMSGNTTRLAVDLVTDPPAAVVPALLLTGFVLGVVGGGVIALRSTARQARNVLALVALLLGCGAAAALAGQAVPAIAMLVAAMGALNNSFQREGGSTFGLTYMTGALVRFGQGLAWRLSGREAPGFAALLALWAGLACGGIAGALAHRQFGVISISLAFALSVAALLAASRAGNRGGAESAGADQG